MGSGSSVKYDYGYYGYKQAEDPETRWRRFFHKDIT